MNVLHFLERIVSKKPRCSTGPPWHVTFRSHTVRKKRSDCTVQIQYCLFLKVVVSWEYRQPFVPTSPAVTSTPETLATSGGAAKVIRLRTPPVSSSFSGGHWKPGHHHQINHRWLIKQPWWMVKLQSICLLHHIGNERTGPGSHRRAEVTHRVWRECDSKSSTTLPLKR